jgi:hypothetical protein
MPPAKVPTNSMPIPDEMWVNVLWMPHSSLSQTSYVTLTIRSAHMNRDRLDLDHEWRVEISIHGMAGLDLVSLSTSTTAAALGPRTFPIRNPSISNATHECIWNQVLQSPIRWRDLPRDAYLRFRVVGEGDVEVSS